MSDNRFSTADIFKLVIRIGNIVGSLVVVSAVESAAGVRSAEAPGAGEFEVWALGP